MTHVRTRKYGFTLLEMGMVIVIIGLVAGGIVMGRELITQAEIRAIVGEYDRYLKSVQEFQDKYRALPGDMNNAESMWGTDGGGCPNNTYTSVVPLTTNTCNGDGDGLIGGCSGDLSTACAGTPEVWRAWQHLSNAGVIEGRYTGIGRDAGGGILSGGVIGVNAPVSKRPPAGWTFLHFSNAADETWLAGGTYGHVFMFGKGEPSTSRFTTYPALPSKDAMELDRKIDDGKPRTGNIRAWENTWAATTCIAAAGSYDLCTDGNCTCALIFGTTF